MSHVRSLLLLIFWLWSFGCAAPTATRPKVDPKLSHEQNLQRLADQERAAKPVVKQGIALPPGVEPAVLALRDTSERAAFMSLDEAIGEVEGHYSPPNVVTPAPEMDPDRRTAALRAYAKGRNAGLDGRTLQAMVELQKARELDPTSPAILRELARIYIAENRTGQAVEVFERLIALEPDNAEAMFAIGLAAASRRDFESAIAVLSRLRRISAATLEPANAILINLTLASALRELGYDRAFIRIAADSIDFSDQLMNRENATRLATVYRQRGETWRAVGDAHCRLGEYAAALDAFTRAAALPTADPAALHPRVIFANLCLDRSMTAQLEMLNVFKKQSTISDRDIRLSAYLKEQAGNVDVLAGAVAQMQRAQPDDSSLTRAAATLLSHDESRNLLKDFVARRPRDLQALTDLLAWGAQQDVLSAVDLTVSLIEDHPDLADSYVDRLLIAVPHVSALLKAVQQLPATPSSAFVETKLLWKAGGVGEAWFACEKARTRWPNDRPLALQQLLLAAALPETALFERTLATAPVFDDVASLLALSQARRALGQHVLAIELAERAAAVDPASDDARIEIARARLALAASLAGNPASLAKFNHELGQTVHAAELAIESSPMRDEAYEVLALIYMPGGVRADTQDYRQTLQKLRENNPQSSLFARLFAQDALAQRRFEQALDRLISIYDSDPSATSSLTLAVTTWQQSGKLNDAEAWLKERMEKRPNDPALFEQWVRVQLMQGRADLVQKKLETKAAADSHDFLSRRLLETVYRATGQFDAARHITEQRLLARPQGMRRELELAALYAGAELAPKSMTHLEWIVQNAADASFDELAGAVRVAGRLQGEPDRRSVLNRDLVHATISRFPDSPLQVYGLGMLTLAHKGELGEEFTALAEQAAVHSRGANEGSVASANQWRELAQAMIDEEQPFAAALAVRVPINRIASLEEEAFMILLRTGLICDAAADAANHDASNVARSKELIQLMQTRIASRGPEFEDRISLADAFYEVSVFYTVIGSKAGATMLLREALQHDPDHAMSLNNLGFALVDDDTNSDEAIDFVERAYVLMPDEPNILDTIGWLRYKQGRFADDGGTGALSLIQKSLSVDSEPSPEVLDHLGDAHWRAGNADQAMDSWRKLVQLLHQPAYETIIVERWQQLQQQGWQMLVFDPKELYDREFGPILERAQQKIAAVESGQQPLVASTFEERALNKE